ncbi:glycosyl transferase family 1 [Tsukamurella pulmonis]|uniref:CgeB family protein n=1 Tax=Tsukamurella pulmonis TaxID=47312 RepID=UPI000791495F|nr:glycosyltransferase [Tsukamurella pulmonis]KXP09303.1 glycosyl transferase family 1 [Tsukamurella pulmonis]RDH13189.1 glycosyltransferase family 1 protein [Tsukamurella pulmonis]
MRILFAGDDWYGSNARSLAVGFHRAGHEVTVVDTTAVTLPRRGGAAWWYAKRTGRRAPAAVDAVHERLESQPVPDLLFCYTAVHLDQERLLSLPAGRRVHYSADDVANPVNTTPAYLAAESGWDAVVTTKAHNVPELAARGVRHPIFVRSAYDPDWHRPTGSRSARRYAAGFVGNARPDRTALLAGLAARWGREFYLAGPGWRRRPALLRSGATVRGPQYGAALSAAIGAVDANLVLLNSDNRDTHTCRTFEVPAAGGLFVGPRTVEHAELLADGREALLYDDPAEIDGIIERVRADPAGARRIAEAGRSAIVRGGHTYTDRAREIIDALD